MNLRRMPIILMYLVGPPFIRPVCLVATAPGEVGGLSPLLGLYSLTETISEFSEDNLQVMDATNPLCPSSVCFLTPVVFPHASSWVATLRTCLLLDMIGEWLSQHRHSVCILLWHFCLTKLGKEDMGR